MKNKEKQETNTCSYKKGYVAFIDVLGFSEYTSDCKNPEKTAKLFHELNNISDFFENADFGLKVSHFSDSLVITCEGENFYPLLLPISVAEYCLWSNMDMVFRGGIAYGDYYHDIDGTHGPAVVEAYKLENEAKASRIIIENAKSDAPSLDFLHKSIFLFVDSDGRQCLNTLSKFLFIDHDSNEMYSEYSNDELYSILFNELCVLKKRIADMCDKKKGRYINKYVWKTYAFNKLCEAIIEDAADLDLIGEFIELSDNQIDTIKDLVFSDDEIEAFCKQ